MMKIFENNADNVQLEMNDREFNLTQRIVSYIKDNFDKTDIFSLRDIKKSQVNDLALVLESSVPSIEGKLNLSRKHFETMANLIDFADAQLEEPFEKEMELITEMARIVMPN